MIGLDGEKMSKSRGNLVLVSKLRARRGRPDGDPAGAARRALPRRPGVDRRPAAGGRGAAGALAGRAVALPRGPPAEPVLAEVRARLADDLDTGGAIAAVDRWVARGAGSGPRRAPA